MQRTVIGFMIAIVLAATGCSGFQELSIEQRNRNAAYCAWKRVRWEYQQQGVPYRIREHLGRGFQQGYYDVSMGSSGAVPLFPPNTYWGVKYQNEAGSAAIGAWFRGYQDGAIAAEKDGLASFNQIPASSAPPAQPGDPSGALTRDEFDGNQEIVPAVPVVPPAGNLPQSVPSELPPLLQPETPATPPATLPILPLPTTPNPSATPNRTTPAPATPSPSGTPPAGSKTTAVPQPSGTAGAPALTPPMPTSPLPSGTAPASTTPPSAAPSATPSPTPVKIPRDPIGGRQTLLLPESSTTPAAQLSLFGVPEEPSAAVEVVR